MTMLKGVRIVEVEGIGPGPFAGMMLADLGAEVIKVQRPGGAVSPGVPEQAILDRGKRSILLDLKAEEGRATFLRLVATADGLIEGFRAGVMERLGIGPAECHAVRPALVYGRMTGWGQEGPFAKMAGHDMNYIGMAGALWHSSLPGQLPMATPTLIGDIGGGAMYLTVGLLAGLMNARATGQGTVVDAAIFDGAANMMNLLMTLAQSGGFSSTRGESLLDGPHWCRTYACADGGIMSVQALEPKFYAIFLGLMGLEDDPDFARQFDRALWPRLADRLTEIFAGSPRAHWEELFAGTDACCAPVLTPEESAAHALSRARKVWHGDGDTLQAAPAPRFSGQPDWTPPPIPAPGQDTEAILRELDC